LQITQVQHALQVMKKWRMEATQAIIVALAMNDDQCRWMLQVLYFGMFVCKNQTLNCLTWSFILSHLVWW
jgi:hypothetical protein